MKCLIKGVLQGWWSIRKPLPELGKSHNLKGHSTRPWTWKNSVTKKTQWSWVGQINTLTTSHSTIFQSSGASHWSNLTGNPEHSEDWMMANSRSQPLKCTSRQERVKNESRWGPETNKSADKHSAYHLLHSLKQYFAFSGTILRI